MDSEEGGGERGRGRKRKCKKPEKKLRKRRVDLPSFKEGKSKKSRLVTTTSTSEKTFSARSLFMAAQPTTHP